GGMNMPFIPGVGVPVPEESRLSQPMARLPQASTVSRCRGHGTDDRITAVSWKRNDRAAPGFPVTVLTLVSPPSVGSLSGERANRVGALPAAWKAAPVAPITCISPGDRDVLLAVMSDRGSWAQVASTSR